MWSSDERSAVDWSWEELSVGSFRISPCDKSVVRPPAAHSPLERLSEAGGSSGAFSACWFVVGPSAVCRSPAWTSVVGWPLEGLPNCCRVVDDSLVGGVLEGASPAGGITLRFSGVGWSLEGLSKVGGTSEGTSPDGGHTTINDGACWFSERLSVVGDSTGVVTVIAAFEFFDCALVLREAML